LVARRRDPNQPLEPKSERGCWLETRAFSKLNFQLLPHDAGG
jgi:hypothetical protein